MGSSDKNAYLRRVHGETIIITHPCHPLAGQAVAVLHYRPRSRNPSVLVELPDLSVQCLPLSWTERARPDLHRVIQAPEQRLSGLGALEVTELLEKWSGED